MTVLEAIKRIVTFMMGLLLYVACYTLTQPLEDWLQTEWNWQVITALGITLLLTCLLWICSCFLLMMAYFYFIEGFFSKFKGSD